MGWVHFTMLLKPLLVALALAAVLLRWRSMAGFHWLLALLGLTLVVEAVAPVLGLLRGNNLWLYNVYLPLSFLLLLGYAWQQWTHRFFRYYLLLALVVIMLVVPGEVKDAIAQEQFIGRGFVLGSALVLPAYVALLLREATALNDVLFRSATTWIALGVVLDLGISIPLLGLLNLLNGSDLDLAKALYRINDITFTMRYGSLLFGVLRYPATMTRILPA